MFWSGLPTRIRAGKGSRLRCSRWGLAMLGSCLCSMDAVFHNGATVNYLFNYDRMRDANVMGTNEVLRLAFEGKPKEFNYVSTTFVFGWAVKSGLYETG